MKKTLLGAVLALCLAMLPLPASAEDTHTGGTYSARGGESTLGVLLEPEAGASVGTRTGWHAHTDKAGQPGWVFWSSLAPSGSAGLAPAIPILVNVDNERDVLYRATGKNYGAVYRTAKLCNSTRNDDLKLAAMLRDLGDHTRPATGGRIIDFRTSGAVSSCPDPKLPGVERVSLPISASYSGFVYDSATRTRLGKALRAVLTANGPVLVHCTYGKDRTGVFISILLHVLGVDYSVIRREYLRSPRVSGSDLDRLFARAKAKYGSMDQYITDGLGFTPEEAAALRAKLA